MTLALGGIAVSGGVAVGVSYVLRNRPIEVNFRAINAAAVSSEVERFRYAVETARQQLHAVRHQIPASVPSDIGDFIDAHLMMLDDPAFVDEPILMIRAELWSAEWALQKRRDSLVKIFEDMDDPYLRSRRVDIDHIVLQIQKILLEQEPDVQEAGQELAGRVILAHDLTPADTIQLRHYGIAAFITESGGPMSHTAILARSLGIPAVVAVPHVLQYLRHNEILIVDGNEGMVLADADANVLELYRRRIRAQEDHRASLRRLLREPSLSRDGQIVSLLANIELPDDIEAVRQSSAIGIGLFRTEFLYMNRDSSPDEAEQFIAYRSVVEGLGGLPVTVRTLDIGMDKQVDSHLSFAPHAGGPNPALGLRAIRMCLKEPTLFMPQLRALLRASAYGPLRVMIPMLTSLHEVSQVRMLLEKARAELRAEGIPFDEHMPLGGMIEVPAAALCARTFARNLDFLSIGSNDLMQYTLAADRSDQGVNYLMDPVHPAVIRLIQMTIDAAQIEGIPVSICGEMAGDVRFVRLLLGLGIRRLSMNPKLILEVKQWVRSSHLGHLESQVRAFFQQDHFQNGPLMSDLLRELNDSD
ncbi:MAG: phosphoenolpyruvate--protein phosphotransferase [Pseudomonadota bacterium]